MGKELEAAKDIHTDAENEIVSPPRYDHNFMISVQTDNGVPADEISKLVARLTELGVAAKVEYFGSIDYETVDFS